MGADVVLSAGKRVAFAYVGATLVMLVLMPIAVIRTMGGHSLMLIAVFGLPVGAVLGLILIDRMAGLSGRAVALRGLVAIGALLSWIALVSSVQGIAFLANNEWTLIPIAGPIIAAMVSLIVSGRKRRG